MKNRFLLSLAALAVCLSFASPYEAGAEGIWNVSIAENEKVVPSSPLILNTGWDIAESTVALGAFVSSYIYQKTIDYPVWNGEKLDINTVNAFDRWAAHPYNSGFNLASNITTVLNVAVLPVMFFGAEAFSGNMAVKDLLVVSKLYADSCLLTLGIKDWIKVGVNRTRPYMYFDNPSQSEIESGNYTLSFPSGHTAAAFMTATFLNYTLCQYYPDSLIKWPVIGTAYGIAVLTGAFRIYSGCHFLTDVLAGAAIGSVVGIAVPLLHTKGIFSKSLDDGTNVNAALSPMGFNISVSF